MYQFGRVQTVDGSRAHCRSCRLYYPQKAQLLLRLVVYCSEWGHIARPVAVMNQGVVTLRLGGVQPCQVETKVKSDTQS